MGSLRDSLQTEATTHTLTSDEIVHLQNLQHFMAAELDALQQRVAASFLRHVAVSRLGYTEDQDLKFDIHPEKTADNLTITPNVG